MGQNEFIQFTNTGKFSAGPNSLGGKFFAETLDDAIEWGLESLALISFLTLFAEITYVKQLQSREGWPKAGESGLGGLST
jgi:hypothetical protein